MNNKQLKFFAILFFTLLGTLNGVAQTKISLPSHGENGHLHSEKCFTVPYNESLNSESMDRFELWLREKRDERINQRTYGTEEEVYIIPVVVHVIHRGEPIGQETNIPMGQIISQIETLNRDFRRLNSDTINAPESFRSIARDTRIEFRLARIDPEGKPTNGVVRVNGNRDAWNPSTRDAELKSLSYWPAEDYINMWAAPLSNNILGYAQFPYSNLAGVSPNNTARLTDGVVVDFRFFGTGFNAVASSRGRTMTHEVGHYLGLRHIWGDGDCSSDDFCNDTPNASRPSTGCNPSKATCDTPDMVQNYMDYSNDECMSIFTACQKERMLTVLLNSPRRKTLINSPAIAAPTPIANDLAIARDASDFNACERQITPRIRVFNAGNNTISQFKILLSIDEEDIEELTFDQTLNVDSEINVDFETIAFTGDARFANIIFEVIEVNGELDSNTTNNRLSNLLYLPLSTDIPLNQDFEVGLSNWVIRNPENGPSFEITLAADEIETNQALGINLYETGELGAQAYLYSPTFSLTGDIERAFLSFKVAYNAREAIRNDVLNVYISTDCGKTFSNDRLLLRRIGQSLNPENQRNDDEFTPEGPFDWTTFRVDLASYLGQENLVIIFEVKNGRGNNIFIDDIKIDDQLEGVDIAIEDITNPSIVSCNNNPRLGALVTNVGFTTITYFEVIYFVNGQGQFGYAFTVNLQPGESIIAAPDSVQLPDGVYDITIRVQNPNRSLDENLDNNIRTKRVEVNSNKNQIPFRERFIGVSLNQSPWASIAESGSQTWNISAAPGNGVGNLAPFVNNFGNTNIGARQWLVSPSFDLSEQRSASVTFKVSHASRTNRTDQLIVLASTDCGESYDRILFTKTSQELAVVNQNSEWFPESPADWKNEFIDLTELVGFSDVRLAFIAVNGNGNNLFVDDIELYLSDLLPPVQPVNDYVIYPNPSNTGLIDLTFNYNERRNVEVSIFNAFGQYIRSTEFRGTLNQTYGIDLSAEGNGLYILKIKAGNDTSTRKVVLNK